MARYGRRHGTTSTTTNNQDVIEGGWSRQPLSVWKMDFHDTILGPSKSIRWQTIRRKLMFAIEAIETDYIGFGLDPTELLTLAELAAHCAVPDLIEMNRVLLTFSSPDRAAELRKDEWSNTLGVSQRRAGVVLQVELPDGGWGLALFQTKGVPRYTAMPVFPMVTSDELRPLANLDQLALQEPKRTIRLPVGHSLHERAMAAALAYQGVNDRHAQIQRLKREVVGPVDETGDMLPRKVPELRTLVSIAEAWPSAARAIWRIWEGTEGASTKFPTSTIRRCREQALNVADAKGFKFQERLTPWTEALLELDTLVTATAPLRMGAATSVWKTVQDASDTVPVIGTEYGSDRNDRRTFG